MSSSKKSSKKERLYPLFLLIAFGVNATGGLLLSIFYLFGGVAPAADNRFLAFLLFLLFQLLWLLPCGSFFAGLDLWGRGYKAWSYFVGAAGFALMVYAAYYLTLQW